MNAPLSRTPSIASRMRSKNGSYCALTSTRGIGRTAGESRRPSPADDQIRRQRQDRGGHGVVDEAEVAVEALVARPEPIPGSGKRKGPDRRTDQRPHAVTQQRHPEDSGGNRDEGPDHGRDPSDQDRKVTPAIEPALGTIELVALEMKPA